MTDFREALSWRIVQMPDKVGWFYMAFEGAKEAPGVRYLAGDEAFEYLDSVVSVSVVDRDRDQLEIDGCEGPSKEGLLPW